MKPREEMLRPECDGSTVWRGQRFWEQERPVSGAGRGRWKKQKIFRQGGSQAGHPVVITSGLPEAVCVPHTHSDEA